MKAIEYLKGLPKYVLPVDDSRGIRPPSNSCIYRWLTSGSVQINGGRLGPNDEVTFPIIELIFFPSGRRRTTIIEEV